MKKMIRHAFSLSLSLVLIGGAFTNCAPARDPRLEIVPMTEDSSPNQPVYAVVFDRYKAGSIYSLMTEDAIGYRTYYGYVLCDNDGNIVQKRDEWWIPVQFKLEDYGPGEYLDVWVINPRGKEGFSARITPHPIHVTQNGYDIYVEKTDKLAHNFRVIGVGFFPGEVVSVITYADSRIFTCNMIAGPDGKIMGDVDAKRECQSSGSVKMDFSGYQGDLSVSFPWGDSWFEYKREFVANNREQDRIFQTEFFRQHGLCYQCQINLKNGLTDGCCTAPCDGIKTYEFLGPNDNINTFDYGNPVYNLNCMPFNIEPEYELNPERDFIISEREYTLPSSTQPSEYLLNPTNGSPAKGYVFNPLNGYPCNEYEMCMDPHERCEEGIPMDNFPPFYQFNPEGDPESEGIDSGWIQINEYKVGPHDLVPEEYEIYRGDNFIYRSSPQETYQNCHDLDEEFIRNAEGREEQVYQNHHHGQNSQQDDELVSYLDSEFHGDQYQELGIHGEGNGLPSHFVPNQEYRVGPNDHVPSEYESYRNNNFNYDY